MRWNATSEGRGDRARTYRAPGSGELRGKASGGRSPGEGSSRSDRESQTSPRRIEAKRELERAIAAAERRGPSAGAHPRIHQTMIDAMRSEVEFLAEEAREQGALIDLD
jgi:hypothetical protein